MARSARTTVTISMNRFPEIARRMGPFAMEVIAETLAEIDATVQVGMSAGGSGRVYTRGGRSHQASAPGAMPAKDYANLAGSLQTEIVRSKHAGYYYTSVNYAPHLEYGTSKMAARPFMTPAAERARAEFMRRMRNLEAGLR